MDRNLMYSWEGILIALVALVIAIFAISEEFLGKLVIMAGSIWLSKEFVLYFSVKSKRKIRIR